MDPRDSAAELEKTIERYNDAWNAQDVETIVSSTLRAWSSRTTPPATASRATTSARTSPGSSSEPDLRFTGRRLYARDRLVVSEWTATATNRDGRRVEWDGIDVFPFENGLILRKDVYSSSHDPRVLDDSSVPRPRVHEAAGVPAEIEQELAESFELVAAPTVRTASSSRRPSPSTPPSSTRPGPQLRIVANYAVGLDNVDLEAARERGVVVTNTPGVLTNATAEHAIGLVLALLRRIAEGDRRCAGATTGSGGRTSWSARASRGRSCSWSAGKDRAPGGGACRGARRAGDVRRADDDLRRCSRPPTSSPSTAR